MNPRITTADGISLHTRFWNGQTSRGLLVVSHGLGEHIACYDDFARRLTSTPGLVDVVGFDYRGHGRSPGRRGVVRRFEEYLHDLQAVLAWSRKEHGSRPRFLLGHSNGGQLAIHAVLADPDDLDGLILSSPNLVLAAKVPAWKLLAGRLLHRVAPQVTLDSGLDDSAMTRDESLYEPRKTDPLRHRRVSAPLFFGMLDGARAVAGRSGEIRTPTLMLLGQDDRVIDPSGGRAFFERLGSSDKTLRVYDGMRHEPLNELGRERVHDEIANWLRVRLDGLGSRHADELS